MLKLKTSNRELTKSEKIILGVAGVLGILFLVNAFILTPLNKKLKPLEEEINKLEKQAEQLATINLDISKNEKELADLKGQYEEASQTIPKTDRYPEVIGDLENMAAESKVKITNSTFGQVAVVGNENSESGSSTNENGENTGEGQQSATSGLSTFTVNLSLKGGFNDVMYFIDKLENDDRILEIVNFSSQKDTSTMSVIYYIAGSKDKEEYDFNNGSYGKGDLFN